MGLGRVGQMREHRYPSDLSDAEWAVIEPLLPAATPLPEGGRPEKHDRRDVVDAILYVVRTGCAWRALPADFPPWQTVYAVFARWEEDKLTFRLLDAIRRAAREQQDRNPQPSAGILDTQSVRAADTVGRETRGYDAGKKTNGRKRFIVTDTVGFLLMVMVRPASVQDRAGAMSVLLRVYHHCPRLRRVFADAGFSGQLVERAGRLLRIALQIVSKPAGQKGFAVIPRRWAVERTLAWLTSYRRLARDYERHPATSEAMIRWAAIATTTRRLTRGRPATRQRARIFPEPATA
jgi:transposase